MLITIIGLALTGMLLTKFTQWNIQHAADLGVMSHQWVAAHNAAQHASSI